jgi:hypothetical protein
MLIVYRRYIYISLLNKMLLGSHKTVKIHVFCNFLLMEEGYSDTCFYK